MILVFKQLSSFFAGSEVYGEGGKTVYTVKGKFAWGHHLKIMDENGKHVGTVKQIFSAFEPKFAVYYGTSFCGYIRCEPGLLRPRYIDDSNDWTAEGNFTDKNYSVTDSIGRPVAHIYREAVEWTDSYTIDVIQPRNVLPVLMLVTAIDAVRRTPPVVIP